MDASPHVHGAKHLRGVNRLWGDHPWGDSSSVGRNVHEAKRPWGETSIHGAKRPWGELSMGQKVYKPRRKGPKSKAQRSEKGGVLQEGMFPSPPVRQSAEVL